MAPENFGSLLSVLLKQDATMPPAVLSQVKEVVCLPIFIMNLNRNSFNFEFFWKRAAKCQDI